MPYSGAIKNNDLKNLLAGTDIAGTWHHGFEHCHIMHAEQEIQHLKGRIAEVFARREQLKQALEFGSVAPRAGFMQLEETDRELSDLDARFKHLWDASQGCAKPHPAALWAGNVELEPIQLDCVTAIMLKILDAKCKMGESEKTALAAVYDVVKTRPGQGLGDEVHALIAQARQRDEADATLAEPIHAWRLRAEAYIPKPDMKAFKAMLRASLPMQ